MVIGLNSGKRAQSPATEDVRATCVGFSGKVVCRNAAKQQGGDTRLNGQILAQTH
jgi:hypothetical protein